MPPPTHSSSPDKWFVLFVEDDSDTRELYEYSFRGQAFAVLTAPSGLHAIEVLQDEPRIRVVVSDYTMPGMNGVDLLNLVRDRYPRMSRILLTGEADSDIVLEARAHHRVLFKGMDSSMIRRAILREARRHGG